MFKIYKILGNVRGLAFKQQFNKSQVAIPYVNSLFEHWKKDNSSVGEGWNEYFSKSKVEEKNEHCLTLNNPLMELKIDIIFKSFNMFRQFYASGHMLANIDPLQLEDTQEFGKRKKYDVKFDLKSFNFQDSELDVPLYFGDTQKRSYIFPFMMEKEEWTIREIHAKLTHLYSQDFGFEYIHLVSEQEKLWIEQQIEELAKSNYTLAHQSKTLMRLTRAHVFNEYLKTKFPTSKRFGLEGNDTLISGLGALVDQCAEEKIANLVFGMAHRGRLSTLANVFSKPLELIFAEFQNKFEPEDLAWGNSGDVKYHLGTTLQKEFENGHTVKLTMLPNPSHLETVNPLVTGKTRAIQNLNLENSEPVRSAMSIIIHGDAAIAGQGVVYEQMQMQNLEGYEVKGTIHVVTNNQIGFTTTPIKARSGLYCTEVAKSIDAPVIHVNGDNPDLVDAVMRMAVRYRTQFQKDIVVDLIGYRRYGHNEQDQPSFTQPQMYKRIAAVKPVYEKYTQYLQDNKQITKDQIDKELNESHTRIDKSYQDSRKETFDLKQWTAKPDDRMIEVSKYGRIKDTGLPLVKLQTIGRRINTVPKDLEIHPTIKKIFDQRLQSIEDGKNIDFATSEALAFGSLLEEGFSVRLSGQDVERGTFSHRHCVLNHQSKDIKYYPLRTLISDKEKQRFQVYNSHLSEYGVLGFEYGYSLSDPNTLTLWEAQFGDFANGAQIVIDNYLSSGESKWAVQSGLVMMLPHGMDGQGPEHSSARMERFLQLMDDNPNIEHRSSAMTRTQIENSNMQIVVCSNAANYFHVLRRQLRREFRKPLILFTSKRLLKSAKSHSSLDQFKEGDRFHRLYPDTHEGIKPAEEIKKVVLCYGQMYYDIIAKRQSLGRTDVAVIRVEQIAPFPYDHFKGEAAKYKNADFIICQEEHQNAGAWAYLEPRVHAVLHGLKEEGVIRNSQVYYRGRKPSSSPAAGSAKVHNIELEKLLEKLFT